MWCSGLTGRSRTGRGRSANSSPSCFRATPARLSTKVRSNVAGARQRLARMAAHEAGTGDENRHEISCGITDSEPAEPIRAELTSASKPPACANRYRTMS
jgi:hypothetical protein